VKLLKVTLSFKTDVHTTGEMGGALIEYLKDARGNPYIPATHVKGVMRCEAERILKATENIPCFITGNPEKDPTSRKHETTLCKEVRDGGYRCDICRLFGVPNTEGGGEYREGKLRITDFKTTKKVSPLSRMHVSIDRSTQTHAKQALYNMHTVPHNTEFTGYIIIRKPLSESESKLLYACLHSMAHYGFGRERSRGLGEIDPQDGLKIEEVTPEAYLEENA
jgi:CRISPR/Cas system CSM-associated protein Csm3 (group 7 of RAMP superfamily)